MTATLAMVELAGWHTAEGDELCCVIGHVVVTVRLVVG